MKKNAFTFYEILIALIVFGIMVTLAIVTIKPEGIRESSLQKAGTAFRNVVQAATQKVLFDWSNDYKMTNLIDPSGSGSFSITDSEEEATPKLTALYKKFMRTRRSGSNKQCTMEFQGACIAYIEEVEGKGSREIKISTSGASAYGKDKSVFDGETIKASDASILSDYQNIDLHSKEGTVSMDGVSKISDFANSIDCSFISPPASSAMAFMRLSPVNTNTSTFVISSCDLRT